MKEKRRDTASVVRHKNYQDALDRLIPLAVDFDHRGKGTIIQVVGATRSGKTQLLTELEEAAIAKSKEIEWEPPAGIAQSAHMPYIQIEADTDWFTGSRRDETQFFRHILRKLLPEACEKELRNANVYSSGIALAREFVKRGVRWLVIDEAHHLMYVKSDRTKAASYETRRNRMETLKSLVNQSGICLILAGGPELLSTRFLAEQFGARCSTIALYLYSLKELKDQQEFVRCAEPVLKANPIVCDGEATDIVAVTGMTTYAGSLGLFLNRIEIAAATGIPLFDASLIPDEDLLLSIVDSDRMIRERLQPRDFDALLELLSGEGSRERDDSRQARTKVSSIHDQRRVGKKYDKRQDLSI